MTLLERFLVASGLYAGALSFAVFFLGRTASLNRGSLIVVLLFSLIVVTPSTLEWLKKFNTSWPKNLKFNPVTCLLLLVILAHLVVYLIGAVTPETKFDALWYHLTEAKTYLIEGKVRTFYPPAQLSQSSVTPRLQDMLYVYTLAFWHNEQLAKLLHFAFGILSLFAVYALGRRLVDHRSGLLAAAIMASFPIFGWLSQTAYIDLSATFYGALVALVFFTDIELSHVSRLIILGLFLSTKIWALIILPIIFVYELVKTRSFDQAISPIASALFIASPWFFEALITTGNPVFPIFSFNQPELLGGYATASQWFIKGWPHQFWPNMQKMFIHNFTLLALIPGLVLFKLHDRVTLVLFVLSIVMYVLFSFISNPDPRFFLPFVAIPSVLLAKLFFDHSTTVKTVSGMAMGVVIVGTLIPQYLRTERSFPFVFGGMTRDQYLSQTLGTDIHTFYDVNHEISSRLGPDSNVVAMVHNQFYITFPYHDGFDLKPQLYSAQSPEELLTRLRQLGFTHILVKTREYKLKDLFAPGNFPQLSQLEYEKIVPVVWSSDVTNTALYKIQ